MSEILIGIPILELPGADFLVQSYAKFTQLEQMCMCGHVHTMQSLR